MKTCHDCGYENIDEAEFCRNCGSKLTQKTEIPTDAVNEPTIKSRPIDNEKIIVRNKNKSIISRLFFKTDKYSGDLRISKAKSISIIVFIGFFILAANVTLVTGSLFVVIFTALIVALLFAVPTYIIGFILGWVIDKLTH